jgi:hypothetical protein
LGPDKIVSKNGKITGLDLVACTCVFDAEGNFCPRFDANLKECLLVDQIIFAIGQNTDLAFLADDTAIVTQNGLIVTDQETLMTTAKGIYAGGDAVASPGAVIYAVAAGRKAAMAIDKALWGNAEIDDPLFDCGAPNPCIGRNDGFAAWPRELVSQREANLRAADFEEIALGFTPDQARREAGRCLQCDLRLRLRHPCFPPKKWLTLTVENVRAVPEDEGVYQLLDENHSVLAIKGTATLRRDLTVAMHDNDAAVFFEYEKDPLYSKRESELIQKYLQAHGEMPGGGEDDLDDLF